MSLLPFSWQHGFFRDEWPQEYAPDITFFLFELVLIGTSICSARNSILGVIFCILFITYDLHISANCHHIQCIWKDRYTLVLLFLMISHTQYFSSIIVNHVFIMYYYSAQFCNAFVDWRIKHDEDRRYDLGTHVMNWCFVALQYVGWTKKLVELAQWLVWKGPRLNLFFF